MLIGLEGALMADARETLARWAATDQVDLAARKAYGGTAIYLITDLPLVFFALIFRLPQRTQGSRQLDSVLVPGDTAVIGLISAGRKVAYFAKKLWMKSCAPKPEGKATATRKEIYAGQLRHRADHSIGAQAYRQTNLLKVGGLNVRRANSSMLKVRRRIVAPIRLEGRLPLHLIGKLAALKVVPQKGKPVGHRKPNEQTSRDEPDRPPDIRWR